LIEAGPTLRQVADNQNSVTAGNAGDYATATAMTTIAHRKNVVLSEKRADVRFVVRPFRHGAYQGSLGGSPLRGAQRELVY
jgi:hypothetical protein